MANNEKATEEGLTLSSVALSCSIVLSVAYGATYGHLLEWHIVGILRRNGGCHRLGRRCALWCVAALLRLSIATLITALLRLRIATLITALLRLRIATLITALLRLSVTALLWGIGATTEELHLVSDDLYGCVLNTILIPLA